MDPTTITTAILTHPIQALLAAMLIAEVARKILSKVDWSKLDWPVSSELDAFTHFA